MSAPPQVQAHNFAKAMRTDIIPTFFSPGTESWSASLFPDAPRNAEAMMKLKQINPVCALQS
jgi:hypothetical protein